MPTPLFENDVFLMAAFNAIPFPTLVVDDDVRILFWNAAALSLMGKENVIQQRGGEALHCIHSMETNDGCGHAPSCKNCVVRNSVSEAIRGDHVYHRKTIMELKTVERISEVPLLITTSPFTYDRQKLALLMVEDIHEFMQLGGLLPICAKCKKIRTENNEWESVERYIKTRIVDIDFSHGLCPDCISESYHENGNNR